MLDLRELLTKHRVDWRDKGSNCSAGNVNIACPLCKTDPSYHLALSESGKGWYCWRNPEHHGGKLSYIFRLIGVPTDALPAEAKTTPWVEPRKLKTVDSCADFLSAEASVECVQYLRGRGFVDVFSTIRDHDLRYALQGRWAGRLIIPLTEGWTARSIRGHILPRYLSEFNERSFFQHLQPNSKRWIILEGALDAMRIASVSREFNIIALCGQKLSPAIIFSLRSYKPSSVYVVPDEGVSTLTNIKAVNTLASYLPGSPVGLCPTPSGFKDPCTMREGQVLSWLHQGNFVRSMAYGT
jgi:hypothetical protein